MGILKSPRDLSNDVSGGDKRCKCGRKQGDLFVINGRCIVCGEKVV